MIKKSELQEKIKKLQTELTIVKMQIKEIFSKITK